MLIAWLHSQPVVLALTQCPRSSSRQKKHFQIRAGSDKRILVACLHCTVYCSGLLQVDTEIFDVLVKETGLTKQQLHDWAKTENELKQVCTPEEIAGTLLFLLD
jgi:hypothetical protein